VGLLEIFHDGERLEQRRTFTIDQRRQQHLRIDRAVPRLALPALHEIDVDDLLRREAFEVERDPHAKRRERAPERK